jgi:hypothetical protein
MYAERLPSLSSLRSSDPAATACVDQAERRLLVAILHDAVHIYRTARLTGRGHYRRHVQEVAEWIASRDRTWVFSFERICEALQIDADHLRRTLPILRHADGGTPIELRYAARGRRPSRRRRDAARVSITLSARSCRATLPSRGPALRESS